MFRDPKQRRFLFALDSDKKKGINQNPIKPGIPSIQAPHLMQTKSPIVPQPKMIAPIASPSLPGLPKSAKFGKIKNYFKKTI